MMYKNQKNANEGFTMLEMIIVVFLVSFSIVSIYGAFSILVILNSDSIDTLKAAFLAQEGLEIIRNIRDINYLNDQPWLTNLEICENSCQVDYKTNGIDMLPVSWGVEGSYLDTDGVFYGYSPSNPTSLTKFKRRITIDIVVENDESYAARVFSEVSWKSKQILSMSNEQSIKVETILYDWK